MNHTIKLLALDLDDTLLDHDHHIPRANIEALLAAEEAGVHVVLASGRTPRAMLPYARELGMDRRDGLLVAYNGASVRDCATLTEEWGLRLGTDLVADLFDWCEGEELSLQTYLDDSILVNEENAFTALDSKLTSMPNLVVDKAAFAAEQRVKCLIPGDPSRLQAVLPRIRKAFHGRATFFTSKPYFLEIMPIGADKGIALERLAGIHGIERSQVMAIGDAPNDLGMIRWAGTGVAMANARQEVKEEADWVTSLDNHAGGVAEAVRRFILDA